MTEHHSFTKDCESFGLEKDRQNVLWASTPGHTGWADGPYVGPPGHTTLDLDRVITRLEKGLQVRTTTHSWSVFNNDRSRNVRLEGTVLKAEIMYPLPDGWWFFTIPKTQYDWMEVSLDLDPYLRIRDGCLEFVVNMPEQNWLLAKLISWIPTNPVSGAHAPAVTMILNANQASLQQKEKEKLEAWLQGSYREGDQMVWKGYKESDRF